MLGNSNPLLSKNALTPWNKMPELTWGCLHLLDFMAEVRVLWEDLHYVSSDRSPRLFSSLNTTCQVLLGRPSGTVDDPATPSFSCNGLLCSTVAPHTLAFSIVPPSFTRKPSALAKPSTHSLHVGWHRSRSSWRGLPVHAYNPLSLSVL